METPVTISYIGHSTVLISNGSQTFLVDPNFDPTYCGLPRKIPTPFDPTTLPPLTAVILTSNYPGHFFPSAFKFIPTHIPVIAPNKMGNALSGVIPNPIIELKMWSFHTFAPSTQITSVPSEPRPSWIQRLWRRRSSGYLFSFGSYHIYLAGTAAYASHFSEIGRARPVNLALLPVGYPLPSCTGRANGLDLGDAVRAFRDLGASHWVPLNVTTYCLSPRKPLSPEAILKVASLQDNPHQVQIIPEGSSRQFPII